MSKASKKAPKVLNLDEYVPAQADEARVISIGGVEHPVLEMSVENFIVTTKEARRLEEADAPMDEQVESTIQMIRRFVPSLPAAELRPMSMAKLATIVSFVRGDDLDQAAAAVEAAAAAADQVEEGAGKP